MNRGSNPVSLMMLSLLRAGLVSGARWDQRTHMSPLAYVQAGGPSTWMAPALGLASKGTVTRGTP